MWQGTFWNILGKLFHDWLVCFVVLDLGAAEVCALGVLLGLTLIPAWIDYCTHCKVLNEITYLFSNFYGAPIEVWKCTSDLVTHLLIHARVKLTLVG